MARFVARAHRRPDRDAVRRQLPDLRGALPGARATPRPCLPEATRRPRSSSRSACRTTSTTPSGARYWDWLTGVLHGDLGSRSSTAQNVTTLLAPRVGNTVFLVVYAVHPHPRHRRHAGALLGAATTARRRGDRGDGHRHGDAGLRGRHRADHRLRREPRLVPRVRLRRAASSTGSGTSRCRRSPSPSPGSPTSRRSPRRRCARSSAASTSRRRAAVASPGRSSCAATSFATP